MTSDLRSDAETLAWLTLLRAPGIGSSSLRALILRAGSAESVLQQRERWREEFRFGEDTLAWLRKPDPQRLAADQEWLAREGRQLLTFDADDYPALLREIGAAPPGLFVVGDAALLWLPQVAIVGARSATAGGLANARSFAQHLGAAGFAITSGLADGVDGAAHAAALDGGYATIAVMGTGPDRIYPRKHRALAARIAESGVLVSEFPPGVEARPDHFPRRNRLIAGLSLGVLVVEASIQSGSLITARLAGDQGREVFALPGSIHNPLARGCHQLIRQGARLVETSDEIVAELAPLAQALGERLRERLQPVAAATTVAAAGVAQRDPEYAAVLAALGHDPVSLDELAVRSGLGVATLSSMLLVLELDGEVSSVGGGRYQRI
ncbi:DNA protecting protein DprA [Tahibacter aquaticus]|uniref:DNA protecting protein DprA n=1 Tax=Tahibacter aquaticus TaxID=520092 RepID=A0A4R6YV32_9GAMM|nr:DNA-processing protein DprA [Tahibacter aquaticus]TDR42517.1 DNA protecting protein DprA [Tahibacter aquaticus]